MRYFFISRRGASLALAFALKREGHDVVVWIKDDYCRARFDGLLRKVERMKDGLSKDRILVFDSAGAGAMADRLRSEGYVVFSSSRFADSIELDEVEGRRVMAEAGIAVAPQDEEGVRLNVEGWFDGKAWRSLFSIAFTQRHFMAGDLGPTVECASSTVFICAASDRVALELQKVSPFLKRSRYVGPISLSCVFNEHGVYGLGWTCHFSYDSVFALASLCGVGEMLKPSVATAAIQQKDLSSAFYQCSSSIRVTIPPYPSASKKSPALPCLIEGLTRADLPNLWLGDVRLEASDEQQQLMTAGTDGNVVAVTGTGPGPRQAVEKALQLAHRLQIEGKQYRIDALGTVEEDWSKICELGYVQGRGPSASPSSGTDRNDASLQTSSVVSPIPTEVAHVEERGVDEFKLDDSIGAGGDDEQADVLDMPLASEEQNVEG